MDQVFKFTELTPALQLKLKALEEKEGRALTYTSGKRSASHNAEIGGASNSYHLKGQAVDISRASFKESPEDFKKLARSVGLGGFGIYDLHVHVDDGPVRSWDQRTGAGIYDRSTAKGDGATVGSIGSALDELGGATGYEKIGILFFAAVSAAVLMMGGEKG